MATKIYCVDGQREAVITVPLANGRNAIRMEFTRGNSQRGAYYRPATCVIADRAKQAMIESSAMFKTGFIRLYKTIGKEEPLPQPKKTARTGRNLAADSPTDTAPITPADETPATPADSTPAAPADETQANNAPADVAADTTYANVKTMEDARVALKQHGAKAAVLLSETAMKNYMAANGIVFPNFEF